MRRMSKRALRECLWQFGNGTGFPSFQFLPSFHSMVREERLVQIWVLANMNKDGEGW